MARLVKSIVSGSNVTGLGETTSSDQLEGRFAVEVAPLTDAANISVDFGANQNFSVTLATGTARTLDNPSNIVVGQTVTGSRTNFNLISDITVSFIIILPIDSHYLDCVVVRIIKAQTRYIDSTL